MPVLIRRIRPLLASMLLLTATAMAKPAVADAELQIDAPRFASQRQAIEKELSSGQRYIAIADEDRREVLAALERMGALLADKQSVDQLVDEQKVKLFNDQEQVNRILTEAAADSQLICRKERSTGSRIPTVNCKTVAQRRFERENSQHQWRHGQYNPRTDAEGGS